MFTAVLMVVGLLALPTGPSIEGRAYATFAAETREKALEACGQVGRSNTAELQTQYNSDMDTDFGEGGWRPLIAELVCIITPPVRPVTKGANAKPI